MSTLIPAATAEQLQTADKLFKQDCHFIAGVATPDRMIEPSLPEVAFFGRSNVGKSSLINALTGRKALARSSNTPGRTQQINFFDLAGVMFLVDLPGYGYAAASKEKIATWHDLIHKYLHHRPTLKQVCILIDARHGLKPIDHEIMYMLDMAGVAYTIVLTKVDKIKKTELVTLRVKLDDELTAHVGGGQMVYATSAEKKEGIPELRAAVSAMRD